jgi:hypothetical protein
MGELEQKGTGAVTCRPLRYADTASKSEIIAKLKLFRGRDGDIYPPLLPGTLDLQKWCKKKSGIQGAGAGLFSIRHIKKGDIIGILGGRVTTQRNRYSVEISPGVLVDTTPTGCRDSSIYGYINDYVWGDHGLNCALLHNGAGMIVATKNIVAGAELFMSYGEHYESQWDVAKLVRVHSIGPLVAIAAAVLGVPWFGTAVADLMDELAGWKLDDKGSLDYRRGGNQRDRLVMALIDGDLRQRDILHRVRPGSCEGEVFDRWLERLFRCTRFHEQVSFREGGYPGSRIDLTHLNDTEAPTTSRHHRTAKGKDLADLSIRGLRLLEYNPDRHQVATTGKYIAVSSGTTTMSTAEVRLHSGQGRPTYPRRCTHRGAVTRRWHYWTP